LIFLVKKYCQEVIRPCHINYQHQRSLKQQS